MSAVDMILSCCLWLSYSADFEHPCTLGSESAATHGACLQPYTAWRLARTGALAEGVPRAHMCGTQQPQYLKHMQGKALAVEKLKPMDLNKAAAANALSAR